MTGPATPLPSALTSLRKKFAPGWTCHVSGPAVGTVQVSYYGAPRSDGTRPTLHRDAPVTSYLLKACHAATGRALVALWVHQHGKLTSKGNPSWSLDMAWRGRHEGEHTPQRLNADQLTAYVRWAATTEISESVPTEEAA